jgi:hypothetical protein
MIRRFPALVVALWLLAAVAPARAQTQQGPSGSDAQPQQGKNGPEAQPAAKSVESTPATNPPQEAPAPKKETKPHKVFTNEDVEGKGAAMYPSSADFVDLNAINECDRYCFEQVRQASHIPPGMSPNWKYALLDGIEKVRGDAAWQTILAQLASIKGKYCSLEAEKNAALARQAGSGTVTEGEISIEEAYERKIRALQAETAGVYERAEPIHRKYTGAVVQFMTLQQQRIANIACPAARPAFDPPDDPDDP